MTDVQELDLVVIGGGHLIRVDSDVAPGYGPTTSGHHHPTAYWFMPTVLGYTYGVPVAWNALGASQEMPDGGRRVLALAARSASYIAVREEYAAEALSPLTELPVHIVPDTAFGISTMISDADRVHAQEALAEAGVAGRYAVIQAAREFTAHREHIRGFAHALLTAGITPIEAAVGPVFGERPGFLLNGQEGTRSIARFLPPLALAALLHDSEAVLAQSLHATIVAMCSGVPVYRIRSLGTSKHEAVYSFPRLYFLDEISLAALDLGRQAPSTHIIEAQSRLAKHWDSIAALVSSPRSPADPALLAEIVAMKTDHLLDDRRPPDSGEGASDLRIHKDMAALTAALTIARDEVLLLRQQIRQMSDVEAELFHVRSVLQEAEEGLLSGDVELDTLNERCATLEQTVEGLQARLAEKQAHVAYLEGSKSWRYTSYLRRMSRHLSRLSNGLSHQPPRPS